MNHYVLDGKTPIKVDDLLTFAQWYESADRHVAQDFVGDIRVSTVFLGYDHGWHGTPVLFETMVFGGPLDGEQERYHTWEEAEAGHKIMLEKVKQLKKEQERYHTWDEAEQGHKEMLEKVKAGSIDSGIQS